MRWLHHSIPKSSDIVSTAHPSGLLVVSVEVEMKSEERCDGGSYAASMEETRESYYLALWSDW